MRSDAAVDGMDPCRAGKRMNDSGCSEDGDATDDAKSGVPRPGCERFAAGDGDLNVEVTRGTEAHGDFGDDRAHRVDGGFAWRQWQSILGDGADPLAGMKPDAAAGGGMANRGDNQGAMSDVGIVTGILHYPGPCPAGTGFVDGERKGRALALRQSDRHWVRCRAGKQALVGGLGGGGGAGTSCPAAAQFPLFIGGRSRRAHDGHASGSSRHHKSVFLTRDGRLAFLEQVSHAEVQC